MKFKIFLSIFLIYGYFSSVYTAEEMKSFKMSYISNMKNVKIDPEIEAEFNDCFNSLKQFSDIQKHRKLTFEEMMFVLRIAVYLFGSPMDNQSMHIELYVNDSYKITVPYSSKIFELIAQQNKEESQAKQIKI